MDKLNKNKDIDDNQTIERLVEFEIKKNQISLTNKEPVKLFLEKEIQEIGEAIVRFEKSGFLISTDKYPRMILAYVKL